MTQIPLAIEGFEELFQLLIVLLLVFAGAIKALFDRLARGARERAERARRALGGPPGSERERERERDREHERERAREQAAERGRSARLEPPPGERAPTWKELLRGELGLPPSPEVEHEPLPDHEHAAWAEEQAAADAELETENWRPGGYEAQPHVPLGPVPTEEELERGAPAASWSPPEPAPAATLAGALVELAGQPLAEHAGELASVFGELPPVQEQRLARAVRSALAPLPRARRSPAAWRRAIVDAEVLAPPLALRSRSIPPGPPPGLA